MAMATACEPRENLPSEDAAGSAPEAPDNTLARTEAEDEPGPSGRDEPTAADRETPAPGEIPFGFPASPSLAAEPGQLAVGIDPYRLAAAWEAHERGEPATGMSFTNFEILEVGVGESRVKRFAEATVPNVLLLPMPAGERAEPGELVFTWWQDGGGLQRAWVTGGSAERPQVRYVTLDPRIEGANTGQRLAANSFRVLDGALEPGVVVSWEQDGGRYMATLLAVGPESLLVFDGDRIFSAPRDATVVPPIPELAEGTEVWAAVGGKVVEARVRRVDEARGKILVETPEGEARVPFGEVLPR
jgi:hypothetical protein